MTESQRKRHVEIIGRSGSGKTYSVILSMVFQDIFKNKSVVCIDGKGSRPFAEAIYASHLIKDAPHGTHGNGYSFYYLNPLLEDISATYNPLYTCPGTNLNELADRVFHALGITHEYWAAVGRNMLRTLIRVLYGTGRQFCLRDIYTCLVSADAMKYVSKLSNDRGAVRELEDAVFSANRGREDSFAQFKVKLLDLSLPIINNYNPDIIPETLVKSPSLLCVSLPSSFKTVAYGLGNMMTQDLKSAISKRFYGVEENTPTCAIYMDEIQTFLNPELMLSALAQFREADCQLTVAHQSGKDLRVYNPDVADTIWENAQMKVVLQINDPETCERLSKMIGTKKAYLKTFRTTLGPLGTVIPAFEESNRETDEYEFHPNFFKKLRPLGQGVLVSSFYDEKSGEELPWRATPLNLAPFPRNIREPLPKPEKKADASLQGLHLDYVFGGGRTPWKRR